MEIPDRICIVLPAKNEQAGLCGLIPELKNNVPDAEIIVVDSGSTDKTAEIASQHGATVVTQPYSFGNGAAIKAGIRAARGNILVLMDADGQHPPENLPEILEKLHQGYDMVVGARQPSSHASLGRRFANAFYNRFASWITNSQIDDLTSGFRAVNLDKAREFLHLLPNGFSYPTTLTMAFLRSGLSVGFVPIRARSRRGESHIRPIRDGIRFLLIIFKVGTLYSPLKVFLPMAVFHFCVGVGYYAWTYSNFNRLTNMSVILFLVAGLIFLIGLLSEQITSLYYSLRERR